MEETGVSWTARNAVWIFAIGFIVSFFYIWGVVQPPLIFQHQQPSFFFSADYFANQMQHPGGFLDYLSNGLTHLYTIPALGALIIAMIVCLIGLVAYKVFLRFQLGVAAPYLSTILLGLLIAAHSNYFYTLTLSLAILLPLLVFLIYFPLARRHFILRIILFSFISRTLYIFNAAPFLLFVALAVYAELFLLREKWLKTIIAILIFSFSIMWPLLVHKYIFLFDRKDMYTYLLPLDSTSSFHIILKVIWIILLIMPLAGGLLIFAKKNKFLTNSSIQPIKEIVALSVLVIALVIFVASSVQKKHKVVIQIDKLAEEAQWEDILETAQRHSDVLHRLITLHYNRALYHTEQLLEHLFGYPQIEGEHGLIRNSGPAFDSAYANAALMFEMGNMNSAQTWANEALSIEGQSPRILKLLALIHLYKNEFSAAEIYVNKVNNTIGNKRWAHHFLSLMNEPYRILNDPAFKVVSGHATKENFLIRFGQMYAELKLLNEKSVPSRMAFEYLLAYNLLSRRLDHVAEMAPLFLELSYQTLPRHVEEALILIGMSGVDYKVDLNAFDFQPSIVDDLKKFMSIIANHNNNTQYAQGELLHTFGDTYWYYHIYHQGQELK